ncbi:unnamed protein product [Onchocerca flexuosa]|uniref:Uncharacterized protein n=1 Tax=Onchocerca flexuosa TaxID=387005 RepID=A0A183HCG6_9BILA|nr:unnamed protein product [Onchocerca flexuosa]
MNGMCREKRAVVCVRTSSTVFLRASASTLPLRVCCKLTSLSCQDIYVANLFPKRRDQLFVSNPYRGERDLIEKRRIVSNDPGVELKQLGEKLCRLISHSSVASSLPSLKTESSVYPSYILHLSCIMNLINQRTHDELKAAVEVKS